MTGWIVLVVVVMGCVPVETRLSAYREGHLQRRPSSHNPFAGEAAEETAKLERQEFLEKMRHAAPPATHVDVPLEDQQPQPEQRNVPHQDPEQQEQQQDSVQADVGTSLPAQDRAILIDGERQREKRDLEAMKALERRKSECDGDPNCVANVEKKERSLLREESKREKIVSLALALPLPPPDCAKSSAPVTHRLLRTVLPNLQRVFRAESKKMSGWVSDMQAITSAMTDFGKAIAQVGKLSKGLTFLTLLLKPLAVIPKIGPPLSKANQGFVEPAAKVADKVSKPLSRLGLIMKVTSSQLDSVMAKMERFKVEFSDGASIVLNTITKLSSRLDASKCGRSLDFEATSARLERVATDMEARVEEIRSSQFNPASVGVKAVKVAAEVVKKLYKPVAKAMKMLEKLKKLLDKRISIILPGFKTKKVFGKRIKVPTLKKTKLSIREALDKLEDLKKFASLVTKPLSIIMKPLEKLLKKPMQDIKEKLKEAAVRPLKDFGESAKQLDRDAAQVARIVDSMDMAGFRNKMKLNLS